MLAMTANREPGIAPQALRTHPLDDLQLEAAVAT